MPKKEDGQKSPFYVAKVYPEMLDPDVKADMMLDVIKKSARLEQDNVGRESVYIKVRHNNPIQVICMSDIHAGSVAAGLDPLLELVQYILENDNVVVVDLGDSVEGIKAAYKDTNRTPLDLQQQIDLIRNKVYEPLAARGKLLGMVSDYWGHPGWAQDDSTLNPWVSMTKGLNIPLIQNGGELQIEFANKFVVKQSIRHNPKGASAVDPVSGLRDEALTTSESSRADVYESAHIHRHGVAEEVYAGAEFKVILISSGTMKGSDENGARDKYGMKLAVKRADPMGQGMIIDPKARDTYPFSSFEQGHMAFEALEKLNRTESLGNTQEIIEKIETFVEAAPRVVYKSEKSRLGGIHRESRPTDRLKVAGEKIVNPYSRMEMITPFDRISYNVITRLPILLEFVANARLGSSMDSDTLRKLVPHLRDIKNNPHSLVVFLRSMVDKDAGASPKRLKILDKYVELVKSVEDQQLAILMDSSLRQPKWQKQLFDHSDGLPIAPASYISAKTEVPLIHHLSLIDLMVGPDEDIRNKPRYSGAYVDKLNNGGSFSKPTFGLRQMYNKFTHEKPAFVVGGHMPSAGTMTFFDGTNAETHNPMLIGTGWWAKYVDTMGTGNVMNGAPAGQGIILMPGFNQSDFKAFPTVSAEESRYMHRALMLMQGLEIMEEYEPGITEKLLGKKR